MPEEKKDQDSAGLFSNTKDAEFAQRIIEMRKKEQDGLQPDDEESKSQDADLEELKQAALEAEEEENFLTRMYKDEAFLKEKQRVEEEMVKAQAAATEHKSFIKEMDDFLTDLQDWKERRQMQVDNQEMPEEHKHEIKTLDLAELENAFNAKVDLHEKQILERLKALNIDPTKQAADPSEEIEASALPSAVYEPQKNEAYLSLL